MTAAVKSPSGILLTRDRSPRLAPRASRRMGAARRHARRALRREGEVVGVLLAGDRADGDVHADDLSLFETFATHAGVLLENDRLEESLSELQELKEQLRHQAYHDALTGLPNRALFAEHVGAGARASDAPARVAVLFLDLDDFKTINDSLGHAAGDELLIAVAGPRARACVRPQRHRRPARRRRVRRAAPRRDTSAEDAEVVAERLVEALDAPFEHRRPRARACTRSIGIAVRRAGATTADELLRNADVAMYAAKAAASGATRSTSRRCTREVRRRHELAHRARARDRARRDRGRTTSRSSISAPAASSALEALVRWDAPRARPRAAGQLHPARRGDGLIVVELGSRRPARGLPRRR